MTLELFLALCGFVLVTSITPGPNNAMLLSSGVRFGFVRTLPHMAGISVGGLVMVVLVGAGLGGVIATSPVLYEILRWVSVAYLLVLAWKIATSEASTDGAARSRPMRFIEAAAFQWVNPKAWVLVVGAVAAYAPPEHFARNLAIVAAVIVGVSFPCVAVWSAFGLGLRRVLDRPSRLRAFNRTMAGLLVLSLGPMVAER